VVFENVLLERDCVPVRVATVESISIVTGALPLKDVPLRPVPIVRAFVVLAVIVSEPPRAIVAPLIVIESLSNAAFGMFVRVFVLPSIDLLVRVSVVALPTRVSVASGRVIVLFVV